MSVFVLITLLLAFYIVYKSHWTLGDDLGFVKSTASGKPFLIPCGVGGRFGPFALLEFNLLLLIPGGHSVTAHYILNAVSFLVFAAFASLLIRRIVSDCSPIGNQELIFVYLCALFLVLKVYPLFLSVVFPERTMVILLVIFILSFLQYLRTNKTRFWIIAIISAVYATFCKEPMAIAFFVFSMVYLLFAGKSIQGMVRRIHYILIANLVLFSALYFIFNRNGFDNVYYKQDAFQSLSYPEVFIKVIRSHKIILILLFLSLIRLHGLIIKKEREQIFYDALLLSGMVYFFILIALKLHFSHYYFVGIVPGFPSLVYNSLKLFPRLNYTVAVLITVNLFMVGYAVKYITNSQNNRSDHSRGVQPIMAHLKQGNHLLWFKHPLSSVLLENQINKQKTDSEVYFSYYLGDEGNLHLSNYHCAGSAEDSLNERSLLLFPVDYLKDTLARNCFEHLVAKEKWVLSDNFGWLKVYSK